MAAAMSPVSRAVAAFLAVSILSSSRLVLGVRLRHSMLGYQQLVDGISQANANGLACNTPDPSPSCLGAPVTVVLTEHVRLPGPLPVLNYSAHLILDGQCNSTRTRNRCIIDGQDQFQIFPFLDIGGPSPSLLQLSNLVFQRALGGVLANTFSVVEGRNLTFRYNTGGVIRGAGRGGKPTQTYEDCRFVNNNGTVVAFGSGKFGLAYNGTGLTFRRTVFKGNRAQSDFVYKSGAVELSGAGVSVFEDVSFVNNTGTTAGGAVSASQTTVKFRRVNFTGNSLSEQTQFGLGGGAVYGQSGFFYAGTFSFCSCAFTNNTNPFNATTDNLLFANDSPPDNTYNAVTVSFCDTEVPEGSVFPEPPRGNVTTGSGQECFQNYC